MSDINPNPDSGTTPPPTGEPAYNGMAIASLVLGIASIACCWIYLGFLGIISIILGIMAKKKIQENPAAYKGDGMALAGIITGVIGIFFFVLIIVGVIISIATGALDNYM